MRKHTFVPAILAVVVPMLSHTPALAASACAAKPMDACQSAAACSWIKAHTRKDGKQVKA